MKLINDLLFDDNEENTILLSWLIKKRLKSNLTLSQSILSIFRHTISLRSFFSNALKVCLSFSRLRQAELWITKLVLEVCLALLYLLFHGRCFLVSHLDALAQLSCRELESLHLPQVLHELRELRDLIFDFCGVLLYDRLRGLTR